MRQLIEATFMSLDGVVDAPKLVEESQRYFMSDEEHNAHAGSLLFAADALLLGRRTYEVFADAYPKMAHAEKAAPDEFVQRMNSIPKYVASTTLEDTKWNARLLKGDIAEEVSRLKNQPGQNILKYGTGPLDHVLVEHNLIDVLHVYLYPFVFGRGKRFFEGVEAARHLQLLDVTRFKSGAVVLKYGFGA